MINRITLLFAALHLICAGAEAESLKGTRPNIILVMTDDQGSDLSFTGHPIVKTPNIDRLAEQSLRLNDFHVSPTCSPTRAALMSGRHEFKNGVTHTHYERELMALSTTTFPQILRQAGYETGIFGKWHLGDFEEYQPGRRGFSEVFIHGGGGIGQKNPSSCADFPPNRGEGCYFDNVLLHNGTVVKTKGYCTDVFFLGALGWIKEKLTSQEPFFAFISTNAPHAPMIAPEASIKRVLARTGGKKITGAVKRLAMIENIDDNFGLMMRKLGEWGGLDNTLIIFTSDNGAALGKRNQRSKVWNAGYRSGKGTPGEGGTHVPCFWYWKGILQAREVGALTAHIDLYRTFCDLAGATIPEGIQELDGRSLLPLLESPDAEWEDRMLFVHVGRWGKGREPRRNDSYAVRTQRWRMVGKELYDISNDPYEKEDVSAQHPEVLDRLNAAYMEWWKEVLPLMVNEKREFKEEAPPCFKQYNRQEKTKGIPEWVPPEIE